MASVIDELMAREGNLDPDLAGITVASAGDAAWCREPGESEAEFIARVRAEARAAGYRVVQINGAIQVNDD